jgi:hypothetical protein
MQRVKSDDLNADDEECPKEDKKEEKISSPIGAGLPLLHRLRLLKEKQVRFRCLPLMCCYFSSFSLLLWFFPHAQFHPYPLVIVLFCQPNFI